MVLQKLKYVRERSFLMYKPQQLNGIPFLCFFSRFLCFLCFLCFFKLLERRPRKSIVRTYVNGVG
jgi:hypothetical protein